MCLFAMPRSYSYMTPHLSLVGAEDAGIQRALRQLLKYARTVHRRCVAGERAVAHECIR